MSRLIRDSCMVAFSVLTICVAVIALFMISSSVYSLFQNHGGMCFSYQCTPTILTNLVFIFVNFLTLSLVIGVIGVGFYRIVKIFKS